MNRVNSKHRPKTNHLRLDVLINSSQFMLAISGATFFIALIVIIWGMMFPNQVNSISVEMPAILPTPTAESDLVSQPHVPSIDSKPLLVGIVSGHAGYDSGAVCDDGLTEAEINRNIALEVTNLLEQRGITVNLLEEFDDRLPGYQADALVSIHADSCNVPGATGFKVARPVLSSIPQIEDKLVDCLISEYHATTKLPEHPGSITHNMRYYHIFKKIALQTPSVIIETGFLLDDRFILEHRPEVVARGIVSGIVCFLEPK
ncbi:MAG: hypothetical protein B6242_03865 [Anaerolineaceae bacterium 4572_78]|nr:MAG: hypothetical protein B6242_03865 [Anaerolineaceae bacterium 4572_78]